MERNRTAGPVNIAIRSIRLDNGVKTDNIYLLLELIVLPEVDGRRFDHDLFNCSRDIMSSVKDNYMENQLYVII